MLLISRCNKGAQHLLSINVFLSKFKWFLFLKDKKGITITNVFLKTLDKSSRKANKTWVDKGCEFYKSLMKTCLKDNGMEISSTQNEEISVAAGKIY